MREPAMAIQWHFRKRQLVRWAERPGLWRVMQRRVTDREVMGLLYEYRLTPCEEQDAPDPLWVADADLAPA